MFDPGTSQVGAAEVQKSSLSWIPLDCRHLAGEQGNNTDNKITGSNPAKGLGAAPCAHPGFFICSSTECIALREKLLLYRDIVREYAKIHFSFSNILLIFYITKV